MMGANPEAADVPANPMNIVAPMLVANIEPASWTGRNNKPWSAELYIQF